MTIDIATSTELATLRAERDRLREALREISKPGCDVADVAEGYGEPPTSCADIHRDESQFYCARCFASVALRVQP